MKYTLVIVFFVAVGFGSYILFFEQTEKTESQNSENVELEKSRLSSFGSDLLSNERPDVETNKLELSAQDEPDNEQLRRAVVIPKFEEETIEFINSRTFDSNDSLNRAFLSDDYLVSRRPLEIIFRSPNFESIVERMSSMPSDQQSSLRQQKLYEQVVAKLDGKFYSEKYACRGKICIIEFVHDKSVDKNSLSKIRDFGINYVFSSNQDLGNSEMRYKGVFIATKDASSMAVTESATR